MKDFSEWLNDLTGELQEPDEAPKINIIGEDDENYYVEVYQGSGDLWNAMPEPCGVCGSTEEVCECEEAEYARHHPENTELWTAAAREFCKQVASSYGLTADIMAKQARAADMELSVKILDDYRRRFMWKESDENE